MCFILKENDYFSCISQETYFDLFNVKPDKQIMLNPVFGKILIINFEWDKKINHFNEKSK